MKGKGILTLMVCVLLGAGAVLLGLSFKGGFNQTTQVNNPMSQFESISELQKSVTFQFQVPNLVAKEKNIRMFNYLNNMIEIQSDNFTFRAAPFVADGADVSGDYNTYEVDKNYVSEDTTVFARYRASEAVTLINLTIQDMTYSMKFETALTENEAFGKLDIDITTFKEVAEKPKVEAKEEETKSEESNENGSGSSEVLGNTKDKQNGEIEYTLVENKEMLVSFMVPKVKSNVKAVANNNQLAVMIDDKVVFVIEYYKNGYKTEEFKGYTLNELNDNYLLRYVIDNTFKKDSQQYKDYYTIIENITTIAKTFNTES